MIWKRRAKSSEIISNFPAEAEEAMSLEYYMQCISPQMAALDLKTLRPALTWLIEYASKLNEQIWAATGQDNRENFILGLNKGLASVIHFNIGETRFVSFEDQRIAAEAESIFTDKFVFTNILSSVHYLQKDTLEEILFNHLHEIGHAYQGKMIWNVKTFGLQATYPPEIKSFVEESQEFERLGYQPKDARYVVSVKERHANAFAGALVSALKIIVPQSFTAKPGDKFIPGF